MMDFDGGLTWPAEGSQSFGVMYKNAAFRLLAELTKTQFSTKLRGPDLAQRVLLG